ncbi:hypothetical protein BaRGS_00001251 [Batillaria attramentaria]|uniref:Uncharacterized protein n=1 Tax=Batillaria attramentaria TaxID=370345 RepID=A0ABD0M7J8_9CAEN
MIIDNYVVHYSPRHTYTCFGAFLNCCDVLSVTRASRTLALESVSYCNLLKTRDCSFSGASLAYDVLPEICWEKPKH